MVKRKEIDDLIEEIHYVEMMPSLANSVKKMIDRVAKEGIE